MSPRCAVVGGGIIGLSIAWRLTQRGARVRVFDAGDHGAWYVAAGMLAAGNESTWESAALGRLLSASAKLWPDFAEELGVPLPGDGTLVVALTADDLAQAERDWARRRLTPTEVRRLEPALSPRVRAGCHLTDDRQVDPRKVVEALRERVDVVPQRIDDLATVDADQVIVAAGTGTAALTGLPIRPVKGELLRLRGEPGLLRHVISGYADGRHVYLVPRTDGEVIVGATQEERTDHAVTAGAVLDLLRAAIDLVPALADLEITETQVGHRPSTPDNAPLLGRLDDRTLVAAGHHRNGVLLAPITADLIAELVVTGEADPLLAPFEPGRFA